MAVYLIKENKRVAKEATLVVPYDEAEDLELPTPRHGLKVRETTRGYEISGDQRDITAWQDEVGYGEEDKEGSPYMEKYINKFINSFGGEDKLRDAVTYLYSDEAQKSNPYQGPDMTDDDLVYFLKEKKNAPEDVVYATLEYLNLI